MIIYEACVGNYNQALKAEKFGANRIELCDNLLEDGTTPSYGTIKRTILNLNIPVMVIIRPRGGNFEYSSDEVEIMKDDIITCKKLGAYGVVIGALKNCCIDKDVIKELVEIAKPISTTFHMAFDEIEDKYIAIDELSKLGVDRILTKGGNENALNGKEKLKDLVRYSNNRISIMPGKGVTKENRKFILEFTGAKEIHGSKVV
ncbi:copper homeostasis protein CutC [Clostridium aestuarii]|uniref:PF03932 family protein CutC n=1 Tax=Clostridium aestuarii TaxID=338193 RepID=A0ABT4D3D3_9CLOT|nr:copper homeostasis protein CutC [Clostridium aestuarii]MCY6485744.1 copper homeostasis protein CutC [Clostridium aestuarii]